MPVKDTLEKALPSAESSDSQTATTAKREGPLRSDPVSLDVPVRVNGSLITQGMPDAALRRKPFEERTSTMIVFMQGAVLRMSTAVGAGQMMVVTNLKSRREAICRVVKVRSNPHMQNYVEVEFANPQADYWGVKFTSEADESPKSVAPAASVPPTATPASKTLSTPAAKTPSEFVKSGSQEDVQLAATQTSGAKLGSVVQMNLPSHIAQPPTKTAPIAAPTASVLPRASTAELRRETEAAVPQSSQENEPTLVLEEAKEPAASSGTTFGRCEASAEVRGTRGALREMLGTDLEPAEPTGTVPDSRKKLILIVAAAAAVLTVGGASSYIFFHQQSAAPRMNAIASSPTIRQGIVPGAAPNSPQPSGQSSTNASPALSSAPSMNAPAVLGSRSQVVAAAPPAASASHPVSAAVKPSEPAPHVAVTSHRSASEGPSMFGTVNAHPVSSRAAKEQAGAPAIDSGAVPVEDTHGLAGIPVGPAGLPAPPQRSVSVPRLISSVLPIYPPVARQVNVEGTVVVLATIEPNGSVGEMKVISGSPVLRQAALNALRQWKYEPPKLDGQDTSTQITISIRFQR